MSGTAEHSGALHCTHCGRAVAETMHTRTAYRVGYYSLHTGEVEPVTLQRGDDAAITVLRLLTRRDVVTCASCYQRPGMRAIRAALFRPEEQGATP